MAVAPEQKGRPGWLEYQRTEPVELSSISSDDQIRVALPSVEFNRVLGGGVVPGSVVCAYAVGQKHVMGQKA